MNSTSITRSRQNAIRFLPLAICLMLGLPIALPARAQHDQPRPEHRSMADRDMADRKSPGTSIGGKWMEFSNEDQMTGQKRVRIELPANEASNPEERTDDRARITLFCNGGELTLSDFRPNTKMAGPDRPSFWGRPQMEVRVRADNRASRHSWNWVDGHFLAMDKGTTRELIGAQLFRVEFNTPAGPQIAEFSAAGLDLGRIKTVCGLTPKKP